MVEIGLIHVGVVLRVMLSSFNVFTNVTVEIPKKTHFSMILDQGPVDFFGLNTKYEYITRKVTMP